MAGIVAAIGAISLRRICCLSVICLLVVNSADADVRSLGGLSTATAIPTAEDSFKDPFLDLLRLMHHVPGRSCQHYPTSREVAGTIGDRPFAGVSDAHAAVRSGQHVRLKQLLASQEILRSFNFVVDADCGDGGRVVDVWKDLLEYDNSTEHHKLVICAETWLDTPTRGIPAIPVFDRFRANMVRHGLTQLVRPLRMHALDAAQTIKQLGWAPDAIYLGQLHSIAGHQAALQVHFDALRPSGIIIGDGSDGSYEDALLEFIAANVGSTAFRGDNDMWIIYKGDAALSFDIVTAMQNPMCGRGLVDSYDAELLAHDGGSNNLCPEALCSYTAIPIDICPGQSHCTACKEMREIPKSHIRVLNYLEDAIDSDDLEMLIGSLALALGRPVSQIELIRMYELLLKSFQCAEAVPASRRYHLGLQLAADADAIEVLNVDPSTQWYRWVLLLKQHETNDHHFFHRYYEYNMYPLFFHWPLQTMASWTSGESFKAVRARSDYEAVWKAAHVMGERLLFGLIPSERLVESPYRYRTDRLHHIYDFIVIHVLLNLLPTDLKQIVEYGCGTSDVGPMLRQLGFKGAHLMYDIYHVTLMQRYFLRYSGYPVYMVGTLAGMNSTYGSVQVPVHTGMLNTAIDRSSEILKKSLFMATFSLTETPIHERDRITSMIDDFAIIYIRSALRFDNVDNSEYLSRLSRELVGKGYTYCFIEGGELRQEIIITFLAVRLDSLRWVSEDFFSRCQSEETIFWARFS